MQLLLFNVLINSLYGPLQINALPPDTARRYATQSISIQVGTTGPRLYYYHSLGKAHRLTLRFGVQYIAYGKPVNVKIDKDSYLTIKPDFAINSTELGLKWPVFPGRAFYLTAGVTYNWHPSLGFLINADNDLKLSGLELKAADIGTVGLSFRWQTVMPYVGVGFGRSMPKNRFSVGFELGLFYMGRPRLRLDSDGVLDTTTLGDQLPAIERNLSGYRYLPSANLTLTYQFNRPKGRNP